MRASKVIGRMIGSVKRLQFLPTMNVDVMVAKVDNSQLVLSYKANPAVDMIIKGLSNYLDNHIPKEIIEIDASVQCVCINLDKIEQLQKPLEMVKIVDVYVENNGLVCMLDIILI